jgi:hypothetical protein
VRIEEADSEIGAFYCARPIRGISHDQLKTDTILTTNVSPLSLLNTLAPGFFGKQTQGASNLGVQAGAESRMGV